MMKIVMIVMMKKERVEMMPDDTTRTKMEMKSKTRRNVINGLKREKGGEGK